MKIFEAMYCDCIHESAYGTISIHKTREGAEKAIEAHKQEKLDEFNELYGEDNKYGFTFGKDEAWYISETELLD